tara:strand:+ start:1924 stop:2115 length:192 start_codon:yes stop_codon:yes gene_type:complete
MKTIQKFISTKQEMLDRGIVATPTENTLESFAQANNGTNDFLLMQMAKNYGYQLALDHLTEEL